MKQVVEVLNEAILAGAEVHESSIEIPFVYYRQNGKVVIGIGNHRLEITHEPGVTDEEVQKIVRKHVLEQLK